MGTRVDITKEHVLSEGEIITEIFIPASARALKGAYREGAEKESNDWALVSASVALGMDGTRVKTARVVLGAVAAVPCRQATVEDALVGKVITRASAAAAASLAFANAKPFEGNAYKIPLGKAIVARAILAAAGHPEGHGG